MVRSNNLGRPTLAGASIACCSPIFERILRADVERLQGKKIIGERSSMVEHWSDIPAAVGSTPTVLTRNRKEAMNKYGVLAWVWIFEALLLLDKYWWQRVVFIS